MATGAIILFALAIVITIGSICTASIKRIPEFLFLLIQAFILFILGLSVQYPIPNNDDVKEGTAHYIEQTHIEIVNGDTINNYKTYKIEWNQN